MDRRQFLKMGVMSSAALSATSFTAVLSGCTQAPVDNGAWLMLRPQDRAILSAIMPVMLQGSFPADSQQHGASIHANLLQIDRMVFNLGQHGQSQLIQLFDLLHFTPSRGLTTGIWSAWPNASAKDIEHFLTSWRNSSTSLFNAGYNGLNRLIATNWYAQKDHWAQCNYPGPPFADVLITQQKPANTQG